MREVKEQNAKNITGCPTRLLDDIPVDHDAFGGTHKRVAKAIADLIENEDGGKAIALIGPWGCGKSTVVEILKKELLNESHGNKEIRVFVFDAWAHRGDPLRRSFLEEFVSFLRKERWVEPKQWEDDLDRIRKRKEEITKETQPILSKTGKILGVSLLLFSLTPVFLSSGLGKGNAWLVGIGGFLGVLPFVTVGVSLLMQHFRRKKQNENENDQDSHEEDQNKDFLLVFINKTREIVRTRATRTPDPTSIEFQNLFRKILKNALSKRERFLVVTIDNLDRISEEEARSIWATMRAFFEFGNEERRPEWIKKFWLLVPLASSTPSRLWQKDKQEGKFNGKSLAEEFIDKTFQIKFYVPLPVMSDWKEFFEEQLKKAFPEHFQHYQEDLYDLYQVFENKRTCRHRPPTPREIKLFINELGAYHRIWQDEIPLPVQALYVLDVSRRIDTERAERVLLNREELIKGVESIFYKESRLQEYLAALHFNVEPTKAVQVLIGNEVKEALQSGQNERLKKIQEQMEEKSFLTVLSHIIEREWQEWAKKEPPMLAKAALALQDLEEDESDEWELIWKRIVQGAREAQWANLDKDVGKGIAVVLRRLKDEEVAKNILSHITEPEPPQESELQQSVDVARNWVQGVIEVLYEIYQSGYQNILSKFKVPGDAEFYVEVMRSLAENEDVEKFSVVEYFVPKASPNAVLQHLAALCQNGNFGDSYAEAVHLMLKVNAKWNWTPLIQQVQQRLTTIPPPTSELKELKSYLKTLFFLDQKRTSKAQTALQELSQKGCLLHWLNYAHTRKDQETAGLCLLPIIEHLPSGNASSFPGQAQRGQQLYRQFLDGAPENIVEPLSDFALKFRKGDVFLQKVEEEKSIQPLVAKVLQKVTEQGRTPEFVKCSAIIEHYGILHDMLQSNWLSEDEFQTLITQLVERAGLIRELMEKGFSEDLADLYLRALECGSGRPEIEKFMEYLAENLRNIPKETWVRELTDEGQLVALIVSLVEKGTTIGLSNHFLDALLEHAKQVLEGKIFPSRFAEQWDKVFEALADDRRQTFLKYLRDELINQNDKDSTDVLDLYGDRMLSEPTVLRDEADKVVRHWFKQMLERQNPEELRWLERLLKETEIYQNCPRDTQSVFCEGVRLAWEEAEDEQVKEHLEVIAGVIGLDLPESSGEEKKVDVE